MGITAFRRQQAKKNSVKEHVFVRDLVEKEIEKLIPVVPKHVLQYGKTNTSLHKDKQNTVSLCNRIWVEFANALAEDLVEKNVRFVVPMKGFGIILICSKKPAANAPQYANLHSNGITYQGTWRTKIFGLKTNIRFRFQYELKTRFKKNIQSGFHYWQEQ